MNKALLVALREFVENLRTKTFWLGILSFPIMIAAAAFIGMWLESSKDERPYAILDYSENAWLSQAVLERASLSDLTELGKALQGDSPEERAAARERILHWFTALPDDHPLRDLEQRMAAIGEPFDPATALDFDEYSNLAKAYSPEMKRVVCEWTIAMIGDPAKFRALTDIAKDLSSSNYPLVTYENLGDEPEAELSRRLNAGEIFAYFIVGTDPIADDAGSFYVSNNHTDNALRKWFAGHTTEIVRERRIKALNLSEADAASLRNRFEFKENKVDQSGQRQDASSEDTASKYAPVAFVYLLWIAVFTAANMLLTNTIEEKSNRLIEVLLSSVSPLQLMTGKILGIGFTGLTIVASWIISALIGVQFVSSALLGNIDLLAIIGNPLYLTSFVAYFLAGYLLYAAFLVAIGSVCNSLKEAQALMQPVFIVLFVPMIAMLPVVRDPNGTIAVLLTHIPLFTPFLMMNRAAGPPPTWEYIVTSFEIIAALALAFWGAAKIFRVGVLMTGKPPSPREILRWLRTPVASIVDDKRN